MHVPILLLLAALLCCISASQTFKYRNDILRSKLDITRGHGFPTGHIYNGRKAVVWPKVDVTAPRRTCPCHDPAHCKPVTTVAKQEGFTFTTSNTNYLKFDWSRVTTLVAFSDAINDTVMCYAHSKGAKVSYGADFPAADLTNPTARTIWVNQQVKFAVDHYMDGINFDYESGIAAGDTKRREALNSLVKELTSAFKTAIPWAQVTFDSPNNPYTDRRFDYKFIADTMDFILIMAYDEIGYCTTGANSGYGQAAKGIQQFLDLGIPGKKLVLGVPWYGYDYPCGSVDKNNKCTISPHCGGRQVSYDDVYRTFFNTTTSGLLWDKASSTPFFTYKDHSTGKLRQAWCDNVDSLILKYKLANSKGLLGVGMWTADEILNDDSTEGKKQRALMWGALPVVNKNLKVEDMWKELPIVY